MNLLAAKAELISLCSDSPTGIRTLQDLQELWFSVLDQTAIYRFELALPEDPDEDVLSRSFDFYTSEYIKELCTPGDDCICGKATMPVGGVDGDDEFAFVTTDLSEGIVILHHDDVFLADDLDSVVREGLEAFGTDIGDFVRSLAEQPEYARFSIDRHGGQWLLLKRTANTVKFEKTLTSGTETFEKTLDSEALAHQWLMDIIHDNSKQHSLSSLGCSRHLMHDVYAAIGQELVTLEDLRSGQGD